MLSSPTTPSSPGRGQRLAILVSGRGSNLVAIARACADEAWPAQIVAVIAHREDIGAVEQARQLGLPVRCVPLDKSLPREVQDERLLSAVRESRPDWVVLAGYMRILSAAFVAAFAGRLVNIHPSLLPAFPGLHTHRQALAAGVKLHGATVHLVTAELDRGPILGQAVVPVRIDDDEASLAARVLEQEHRLYPRVLRALVEGTLVVEDGRSRCPGSPADRDPLLLMPSCG